MRPGTISRRRLLKTAALAANGPALLARPRPEKVKTANRATLAFAGVYDSTQGIAPGKASRSGIAIYEMNPESGALLQRDFVPHHSNPAWLAISASGAFLYAANETDTFEGHATGSVSAFAVERSSGRLTWLNDVSSEGTGPAHISIHPSGKYVFVANYNGGTFAVLPISPDGKLGAATDCQQSQGTPGPDRAASAPPGSFAVSGHDGPHAHMMQSDPAGRYVLGADLGLDRIFTWAFNSETGRLTPIDPAFVSLPPGDGPRHFAFHPNRRWLYSIQEEASMVTLFDFDESTGRPKPRQTVSSIAHGFAGSSFASEIIVSADGRFLYAGNRLHDSIAIFSISPDGILSFVDEEWTRGDYPNTFNVDPGGRFLYSCNQRSDAIAAFRINRETGRLSFTGQYTPAAAPSSIVFLTRE